MSALTATETARYGVRLFGYLLASTLVGALLAGGGLGVAYLLDPALVPGGTAPGLTAVAVAVVFGLVGLLAFAAGLTVVGFVAVTDAVRLGIERSGATTTAGTSGPRSDTDRRDSTTAAAAEDGDAPADPGFGEPTGEDAGLTDDAGGGRSDGQSAGGDPIDPTDPVEDPHSASSDPLAGPVEAGGEGDEAWREEIEAKLDDDRR